MAKHGPQFAVSKSGPPEENAELISVKIPMLQSTKMSGGLIPSSESQDHRRPSRCISILYPISLKQNHPEIETDDCSFK
jgi:hypothetical protein